MIGHLREVWRSGGLRKTTKFLFLVLGEVIFRKSSLLILLCGAGVGLLLALGQSFAIGFYPAWKIYGLWWVVSPLYGPLAVVLVVVMSSVAEYIQSLASKIADVVFGVFFIIVIGSMILFVGYEGTREDNPLLSSHPANLEALSKSVGEQGRVLGELSESGVRLISQLNATEIELETAKKQLAVTLGNFDAQRKAAGQVTEEVKQIDVRQKQIALQTEELERILGGQQPITRHDLQRASMQGVISGLIFGFVTSFLATIAYSALRKRKSFSVDT